MDKEEKKLIGCQVGHSKEACQRFHETIELIGKRWNGIIIYSLLRGPMRYHELQAQINGISDRLLTERLKELEKEGLVVKNISADSPRKVEYELTEAGKRMEEIIQAILKWISINKK